MATLYVKDVPEELYGRLKEMAVKDRRSISAETIVLLEEVLVGRKPERGDVLASVERNRAQYRLKPGKSLVELLREDRER